MSSRRLKPHSHFSWVKEVPHKISFSISTTGILYQGLTGRYTVVFSWCYHSKSRYYAPWKHIIYWLKYVCGTCISPTMQNVKDWTSELSNFAAYPLWRTKFTFFFHPLCNLSTRVSWTLYEWSNQWKEDTSHSLTHLHQIFIIGYYQLVDMLCITLW